jgi:hypothetical protein
MKPSRFTFILGLALSLSAALLLTACTEEDPITGSVDADVLTGSVFTITERFISGGTQMTARGTIKNAGKNTWSPVWKVEGDFYTDSTFTFKLGGAAKSYSFSLAKNETTAWELKFTSNQFTLSDYPNFAVKNLRVVQN